MIPAKVLRAYDVVDARIVPLGTGLINETFLVEKDEKRQVLQRLHSIFDDGVIADVEYITEHLAKQDMRTPFLVRSIEQKKSVRDDEHQLWRMLTFVEGQAFDTLQDEAHAAEAGRLVARFHKGIASLGDYQYQKKKRAAHDTMAHQKALVTALLEYGQLEKRSAYFSEVSAVSTSILMEAALLPNLSNLSLQHAHGDLKVSNLLFDDENKGLCLVDLDTLAPMAWVHEMGDAFRSWCNPKGEDAEKVYFDSALFFAAVEGYFAESGMRDVVAQKDRGLLVDGIATICLELSARFLTDALEGKLFGWNADAFESRSAHNLHRAKKQWELYLDVKRQSHELKEFMAMV